MKPSYITSYATIHTSGYQINGKSIAIDAQPDMDEYLREVYKDLGLQYPKFHKMDRLSKLGFLASEIIIANTPHLTSYQDDEIALLFANQHSSADTDKRFEESYTQTSGAPSPALFVYTLPNILLGEIAIKNKWYGENLFLIQPEWDANFFVQYCHILLSKNSKAVLCGWIDVKEEFTCNMVLVEATEQEKCIQLTTENLTNIFLKQ